MKVLTESELGQVCGGVQPSLQDCVSSGATIGGIVGAPLGPVGSAFLGVMGGVVGWAVWLVSSNSP